MTTHADYEIQSIDQYGMVVRYFREGQEPLVVCTRAPLDGESMDSVAAEFAPPAPPPEPVPWLIPQLEPEGADHGAIAQADRLHPFARYALQVVDLSGCALPFTDLGALQYAGHPRFMPADVLDMLLYRDRMRETGFAALPTTVIDDASQVLEGTLVKARHSVNGGYVRQPHLGFPQEDLDLTVAVNASGDVHLVAALRLTHADAKKPVALRLATYAEYAATLDIVADRVQALGIRGGIHNAQFLWAYGWKLVDWNPRPPVAFVSGLHEHHPFMEQALRFVTGTPLLDMEPPVFQNRHYWERPIDVRHAARIREMGLVPRVSAKNSGIPRVSGVGVSEDALNLLFDSMEAEICG